MYFPPYSGVRNLMTKKGANGPNEKKGGGGGGGSIKIKNAMNYSRNTVPAAGASGLRFMRSWPFESGLEMVLRETRHKDAMRNQ